MADIVVFDITIPVDPISGNDKAQRVSGMKKLGEVFNRHFQNAALSDEEIVNNTIREIIALPQYIVTYQKNANVLRVKNIPNNKYYFNPPGTPVAVLKLKAARDKQEMSDGELVDKMNIVVPKGNNNLLAAGNYLSKVITDMDGKDGDENRAYLLGTITFRRCR
jgi:hypothetical protein